jgi:hypothetical protein
VKSSRSLIIPPIAAALAEICAAASDESASSPAPDNRAADIVTEFRGLRRSWPRMARNIWRDRSTCSV